jgi:hypothetical protein
MSFRPLTVVDAQSDEVTIVALADVAADIRRYEVLVAADSGGITGAPPPRQDGRR